MVHFTIQEEVEKALSGKLGEAVFIKKASVLGGGCINHASKIETNAGTFFLKWNAHCADDMFLREAEGLQEMRKAVGDLLTVPEVFAAKKVDETPGFLVLEYLPSSFGSRNDELLGRGLAAMHRYSAEQFGFYHDNYCGATPQKNLWKKSWPEFFTENRILFLLHLIKRERPFPADEMRVYDRLVKRIPELVPHDSTPVLIHGDLWSGNYMRTGAGFALIDPAAYYADREMEFGIMTMFGGFSSGFYDAYNEANPLPPGWKERNLLYQLYHVLNHYYLFGGGYGNQALRIARGYL